MKSTLILFSIFVAGILSSVFNIFPEAVDLSSLEALLLNALLFVIGLGIGMDRETMQKLRSTSPRILLVPLGVVIGSLGGASLVSLLLPNMNLLDSIAVGGGFGYYSISSVLLTRIKGTELGVIALMANIFREMSTIFFAPLMVRLFGRLAPIASGGATSMDITLPVIQKFSGKDYVVISIVSGIILSILVPILVPIIAGIGGG